MRGEARWVLDGEGDLFCFGIRLLRLLWFFGENICFLKIS